MGDPSILGTATRAWRSTLLALIRMPIAFLITLALATALQAVVPDLTSSAADSQQPQSPLMHLPPATIARLLSGELLASFLTSLLLAPLAIAVHRFALLGERSPVLPLTPLSRVLRFAGWLTIIGFASDIADWLGRIFEQASTAAALIHVGAQVAFIVVATRLTLLFPALAIEVPGTEARVSWRDTRGHFWRVFLALTVTLLPPLIILVVLLVSIWGSDIQAVIAGTAWAKPLLGAYEVLLTALGAAAASWLFRSYGEGFDRFSSPSAVQGS